MFQVVTITTTMIEHELYYMLTKVKLLSLKETVKQSWNGFHLDRKKENARQKQFFLYGDCFINFWLMATL